MVHSQAVTNGEVAWSDEFREALGPGQVDTTEATLARYGLSTSGEATPPAAVVSPGETREVQAVTRIARAHGLELYPISRGRNWGYGDARASSAGQVIVDLSRMDRIHEVSDELAYAVIEPGVTQGQLADYLKRYHPGLWPDCTGAGLGASLVGNTLDRGFGHTPYGDHSRHTCGMEVVLADGSLLRTGMWQDERATTAHVYPHGVGPSLDGLFQQSNFGIVTRIGLWLMPAPEAFCAFFVQPGDEAGLSELVDRLAPLRRRGTLRSAIHIGNDLRILSGRTRYPWDRAEGQTPLPAGLRQQLRQEHGVAAWNAAGGLYGSAAEVRAAKRAVKRALRGMRLRFVDDRKLAVARRVSAGLGRLGLGAGLAQQLRWLEPVYGLMKGEPSDEPLSGVLWRVRDPLPEAAVEPGDPSGPPDPLTSAAGLMWVSPVLPATGTHAQRVREILEPIYEKHGFEPLITFTLINERAIMAVTNVAFDRRDASETERAHACYDELYDALMMRGYMPYRAGPSGQRKLAGRANVFWQVTRRLKAALDPDEVIAPGRYVPRG